MLVDEVDLIVDEVVLLVDDVVLIFEEVVIFLTARISNGASLAKAAPLSTTTAAEAARLKANKAETLNFKNNIALTGKKRIQ